MGRRARAKGRGERLRAPDSSYEGPGATLVLRGALSPRTRREYALSASGADRPAATPEDSSARALELLFERLAVRWTVNDVPTEGQRALLERFRVATPDERGWVRQTLREHLAEHFSDLEAP